MSTATSSAAGRFAHDSRPISSTRGETLAASGWTEFASASHESQLLFDEKGNVIDSNFTVWTGTSADGTFATASTTCEGWTVQAGQAISGDASNVDGAWTNLGASDCASLKRLYCLEK